MRTLDDVIALFAGLSRDDVRSWVAQGWVIAGARDGDLVFDDVDVARIRFIQHLRNDLEIGDEALPAVLSLVDQIYGLRRELKLLADAVDHQPPRVRAKISAQVIEARRQTVWKHR